MLMNYITGMKYSCFIEYIRRTSVP